MDDLSVALNNSGIGGYLGDAFLVVYSFFEKTTYCCRSRRLSVRLSSVEIISFRGSSLSNRPIDLKIGLNVRAGVVHVRKAWFFEICIASCNFFAIYVAIHANYERYCRISLTIIVRVSTYTSTCGQTYCSL